MELRYFVPFKAQEGVSAEFALREKLLNIEGVAIDTSVNTNKWQVPEEDLDFFVSTLKGSQMRIDHAESAMAVIGKVPEAKRSGLSALFRAEIGDLAIIEKVLRGYLTHVSVQVDSDDVECSQCRRQTRKEGMLIHLCPGAWEIVHKPKVRELSIVASPAYKNTEFKPVGFAAAMNESQGINFPCATCTSRSCKNDKDVGSKRELQEPENKRSETQEVKHLSEHDAQQGASAQQAQGIVNVNQGQGESAPKELSYNDLMNQLTNITTQIYKTPGATDAELAELSKRVAAAEAELAKRATKKQLSKRIAELGKKFSESAEEGEEGQEAEAAGEAQEAESAEEGEEGQEAEAAQKGKHSKTGRRASGVGVVALDEIQHDALGDYTWFKDLLKARTKLVGMK